MESNSAAEDESMSAQNALEAIGSDRRRIGERMTAETWWAAPAQGVGVALLVGGPAAGFAWAWLPFLASVLIFLGIELYFRKRSGLTISRPAGPWGLTLLVVLALLLGGALAANIVLMFLGQGGAVLLIAVGAGVVMALGVWAYDRTFAAEVSRAR